MLEVFSIIFARDFLIILHPFMAPSGGIATPMNEHSKSVVDKPRGFTGCCFRFEHKNKVSCLISELLELTISYVLPFVGASICHPERSKLASAVEGTCR